ncbi:ribose 5-phosphate isomerase A, partial [Limosilactobacillus fermentum]|nr:ribose 5-phosphate isomerase A [Limosilactobacillus fermentum]
YRTDENNYIIDLKLGPLTDPLALAEDLINTVGVVEHGLFLNRVNQVIVGNEAGITTLTAP